MFWQFLLTPAIAVPPTMVRVSTPVDLCDRHRGSGEAKVLRTP
jgi:hypothetical protein